MSKEKLILVTNDDGIHAQGIQTLAEEMRAFGRVLIVAPDKPQSAMGHAITIHNFLRMKKEHVLNGVEAYSCTGTPVDCVKLALYNILDGERPDLLVSGINHGLNASINVLYSGTMSAAVEGAIERIPSIGFSLLDHSPDADMDHARSTVQRVTKNALEHGITPSTCLNVNIPRKESGPLKGIKTCVQADANWEDGFEVRKDPSGKEYLWLKGRFIEKEHLENSDMWALNNGYASVVPVQFDMTAHDELGRLGAWDYEA
jgi:5'-nucleotidase